MKSTSARKEWYVVPRLTRERVLSTEIAIVNKGEETCPTILRLLDTPRYVLFGRTYNASIEELSWSWLFPICIQLMGETVFDESSGGGILSQDTNDLNVTFLTNCVREIM